MSEVKFTPIEVTFIDSVGSDLTVVNAARVSFDKESDWALKEECCGNPINCKEGSSDCCGNPRGVYELSSRDTGLINYLAKHKHLSPFNHAFATFRVKAPIFVARQLVKHEYMPWNEVSRRYVDSDPEFYMPDSFREAVSDKKQGSGGDLEMQEIHENRHQTLCNLNLYMYKSSIEKGMCPEQARGYLNLWAHTEWYWSGSLGAFAKMLGLRMAEDTQYESRVVANLIYEELIKEFPISLEALLSV